jgi:hypothetical protein
MEGPTIEFLCVAAAHRPRRTGEHASTVTVYEGRWAYCDSIETADHEWMPSGGVSLELLRRGLVTPAMRTG